MTSCKDRATTRLAQQQVDEVEARGQGLAPELLSSLILLFKLPRQGSDELMALEFS